MINCQNTRERHPFYQKHHVQQDLLHISCFIYSVVAVSSPSSRPPQHAPAQVVRLSAHTVRVIPVGDSSNATRETDGGCQAQHEPRGQWRQREQRRSRPSNFGGAAGTGLQRLWWMPLRHPYGLVVVVGPAVLVGVAFPGPVQERHRSQGHRSRLQSPEVPGVPGVPAA